MTQAANWDASRYHRVTQPHVIWGASVLDRLNLLGDELVLDAGCGSGRVTAQLLERLPRGHVIAADHSAAMLEQARETLAPWIDRVTILQADLLEIDRRIERPVDAVFSTAVFHWISDHPRLFNALRRVLRDHGRLVAQCGGGDNLARFMQATDAVVARPPFAAVLQGLDLWRYFYGVDETRQRLLDAGFAAASAWLEPSPQVFAGPEALADFARGVVLTSHVAALPESLREGFVHQVVEEIGRREGAYSLDYVRLNIQANA
jgi:trans-aconitate 2-methyltransferase